MATLVTFHAHPDDECIGTGGTMAKASADGHRVVLVTATRGEHGEVPDGFLEPGEALGLRRISETLASAKVLGVDRVEFLGYVDSGMMGTAENDGPYCFWRADIETAAARLAAILREEAADVLTIYDDNGGYGHPDHIQIHRVGVRAAEMAGVKHVYEGTINRDSIARAMESGGDLMSDEQREQMPNLEEMPDFGVSETRITHAVDVAVYCDIKRASMRCHRSQIAEENFFLSMPDEAFQSAFGTEWFIAHGETRSEGDPFLTDIFEGVAG